MPTANKLHVIGIGYRPLSEKAREITLAAEVLLASTRLFEVFQRYDEFPAVKDRIRVINKVPDTIAFIRERLHKPNGSIVLLASGDPLFFGIGRRMREEFGSEIVEIYPDLSSMQVAFSRINEPWDDAFFISLHGGPDIAKRRKLPYEASDIPWLFQKRGKLGILTDRENNPAVVAQVLNSAFRTPHSALMYVCEHLGYPDERIVQGSAEEMATKSFADPNVVILLKGKSPSEEKEFSFGIREEEITNDQGLITKDEVRAVTLHKLRLPAKGVFWDIGAGSGSVSLEAARICPGLRIFALEKDRERAAMIRKNMAAFHTRNIDVRENSAPKGLQGLPAPDRVFIGGSGGDLDAIVAIAAGRMGTGIIIINAATLETLHAGVASLERGGFKVDVSEVSVARSKVLAGKKLMTAMNPVFILKGERF